MSKFMLPARDSLLALAAAVVFLPLGTGCGDGQFPIRAAKGKVVCGGQPVTVGSVTFSPVGGDSGALEVGKSATAAIGPDGTFVLTTHQRFDGAVVGKHRVQYVGPEGEEAEGTEEDSAPAAPEGSREEAIEYAKKMRERKAKRNVACVQKEEIIVEVKEDGENDFTIELTPAGR